MAVSKSLSDRIGRRPTCLVGILLTSGGKYASYFTIRDSVIALGMTLGAMTGLGTGIIISVAMTTSVEWADKYTGIAVSGYSMFLAFGSIINNQVITLFINPDNLKPNRFNGKVVYFSQPKIFDRVPHYFLLYGTMSTCISLFFVIFMRPRNTHLGLRTDSTITSTSGLDPTKIEEKYDSDENRLRYIQDDHFLNNLSTAIIVAMSCLTCVTGIFTEKITIKSILIVATSILFIMSAFYYFIPRINRWFYSATSMLVSGLVYVCYSLFRIAPMKIFGATYLSTNYALISMPSIVMNLIATPLVNTMLETLGWFSVFFFVGVLNLICLILFMFGLPHAV